MKILFVAPYAPVPPTFGGALRIYHLLKQSALRHEVSLIAYGGNAEYQLLREHFGQSLRHIYLLPYPWTDRFRRLGQLYALCSGHSFFHHLIYSQQMQSLIDAVIDKEQFDLIQTEFAVVGAFDFKTDAVKILDAHNVEYDNFLRMSQRVGSLLRKIHYRREYKKFFREEIAACRKYDALFITSQRDKYILHKDVPSVPKFVIPNGVDTDYFASSSSVREENSLVFTGMMGYVPNYDGMEYFLDQIFPHVISQLPDAKVYIVGGKPPKHLLQRRSDNIIVTGYVNDVRPFIDKAKVYVVPLRMGGGTRLKILEAMSMKIPIVTTSIGCEGIEVKDNETAFVRDEPVDFAHAVVNLLRDEQTAARLIKNSYDKVRATYDWSIIGEQADYYYTRLVNNRLTVDAEHEETVLVPSSAVEFQHAG
ncbi:MAG: glycosyltransferase [Ignavibacteriales bacterium]|nr:glycosyltransferase [Ignavibacteriales bacterium]